MKKTTFYFVRHGRTDRNTQGKLPGDEDDPLDETGISQAKETAGVIDKGITILASSPLKRASETGKIITELACPIIRLQFSDDRLREVNFGDFVSKTWDEVSTLVPSKDLKELYRKQEYDFTPYNGESYEIVKERLYSFIEDAKKEYPGEKILVATHAGIIRCLYKKQKNYAFPDAPPNASVHKFEF